MLVSAQELREGGIATIGEVGGFPRVRVGLGEGLTVTVVPIRNVIKPRKVGVEARGGHGEGFLRGGGRGCFSRGGWGSWGLRGGSADLM